MRLRLSPKQLSLGVLAIGVVSLLAWETITHSSDPAPSASPSAGATTGELSNSDKRTLRREFERAQATSKSALLHRQKSEIQELKAAQKARRKEWLEKEKTARHQFLAGDHKGPEIRVYMRDYQSRLRALDQMIADELAERRREHKARYEAEVQDQSAKLKEFMDALGRGERPAQALWPATQ